MSIPPWVYGPFELLVHAELHYRAGGDFDRRIALISFDNSIEVSVMNYLSLDAMHRGGRQYGRADREIWTNNLFSSKLDFIESECDRRAVAVLHDKAHMTWYHKVRNKQYHEGEAAIPTNEVLNGVRSAAIWAFGMLYEVSDVEKELEERIVSLTPARPEREPDLDKLLDEKFGMVKFGDYDFYASGLVFDHDPIAYKELALVLKDEREAEQELSNTDQLKLDYWTEFQKFVLEQRPRMSTPKPQAIHWMDFNTLNRGGFWLGARINTRQNVLTFGFYNTQPKEVFRALLGEKDEIEAIIGSTLEWDENPTKKQSQAELRHRGFDVRNRQQWPEQHKWFLKQFESFMTAFSERVRVLDVTNLTQGGS